jgi:hypothetical protein
MPNAMPPGPSHARQAPRDATRLLVLALSAILLGGITLALPPGVDAATARPLAVIVVGPTHGVTTKYLADANRIAEQLRAYGARVRRVYSPWATWDRVRAAARGANLFIYLGHGNGYPSPHGPFNTRKMDGLGLNAVGGRGHWNTRYYGEYYVARGLHLAPGAVVILNHVCYAGGSSEPGYAYPRRATATRRVDNFAAGFLRAGAAAVFATDRSPRTLVRDLFRTGRTMAWVFWNSPDSTSRYASTFWSRRTPGMRGILAPRRPGQYYMAVTGRLTMTALEWRQCWNPPLPAAPPPSLDPSPTPTASPDPAATPTPDPGSSPSPDPAATPTPTPSPGASPAPDPGASPAPDPTPDPGATPTPAPEQTPTPEPTPPPGG